MADYLNGKIYCLESDLTEKVYIGSTTGSLKRRLSCHEKDYKRYTRGVKYIDAYGNKQRENLRKP